MTKKNRAARRAEPQRSPSRVNDVRFDLPVQAGDVIHGTFYSATIHDQKIGGDREHIDATLYFQLVINDAAFLGSCKVRQAQGKRYHEPDSVEVMRTVPVLPPRVMRREDLQPFADAFMKHLIGAEGLAVHLDGPPGDHNVAIKKGEMENFAFEFEHVVANPTLN